MNLKLTKDFDEIEYGIVKGTSTILFVKAG